MHGFITVSNPNPQNELYQADVYGLVTFLTITYRKVIYSKLYICCQMLFQLNKALHFLTSFNYKMIIYFTSFFTPFMFLQPFFFIAFFHMEKGSWSFGGPHVIIYQYPLQLFSDILEL